MTQTLTRTGIVAPAADNSDPFDPVTYIRNNANWAETLGAMYSQDTLANRPAAGKAGRFFKATDALGNGIVYYDTGTAWETVGAGAPTDGSAATPSLRTLGSGSTQAAAGNHTHALGAITGTGDAAAKNTGTTTGTVAAGDHTHSGLISALFAQKSADTSRTSTTTLADDPHLVLTLAASSTYAIRGVITYRVTATPKLKMNFRVGSGVTFKAWSMFGITSLGAFNTGTNVGAGNNAVNANDVVTYSGTGNMGSDHVFNHDLIVTTGASGTYDFAFQWAQNTSDASAATVTFGSYLLATKIA